MSLGSLDRSARLVNVAKNLDPVEERSVIAHEIGHFRLHRDPHNEVTDRPHGLGGDLVDSGAGRVEGYSPRERKEVQAAGPPGKSTRPSSPPSISPIKLTASTNCATTRASSRATD